MTDAATDRMGELARNVAATRQRIADACTAAGRPTDAVTLIAVTKTYPAADVRHLASLGVPDVGENRDQEAAAKALAVAEAGVAVVWHFIGQLQRNKCRSVVRYAGAVHSVDSVALARALGEAARHREQPLDACVQVSLDADVRRGGAMDRTGVDPDRQLARVLAAVAAEGSLRLRGLMAVAPLYAVPEQIFAELAAVAQRTRVAYPAATWLSAGMSADFEVAVAHGSTHVRVGSALLGKRASLR